MFPNVEVKPRGYHTHFGTELKNGFKKIAGINVNYEIQHSIITGKPCCIAGLEFHDGLMLKGIEDAEPRSKLDRSGKLTFANRLDLFEYDVNSREIEILIAWAREYSIWMAGDPTGQRFCQLGQDLNFWLVGSFCMSAFGDLDWRKEILAYKPEKFLAKFRSLTWLSECFPVTGRSVFWFIRNLMLSPNISRLEMKYEHLSEFSDLFNARIYRKNGGIEDKNGFIMQLPKNGKSIASIKTDQLYIRRCYRSFWTIFTTFQRERRNYYSLLKGLSGTGKTAFLLYFMHRLSRENVSFVFHSRSGMFWYNLGKWFEIPSQEQLCSLFAQKNAVWYLCDDVEPKTYATRYIVLVTSPRNYYTYKRFSECDRMYCYMPTWSLYEFHDYCDKIYGKTKTKSDLVDLKNTISARYNLAGGIANIVLRSKKFNRFRLNLPLLCGKVTKRQFEIYYGHRDTESEWSASTVCYEILHLIVRDEPTRFVHVKVVNYMKWKVKELENLKNYIDGRGSLKFFRDAFYDFASEEVKEMVCERLALKASNSRKREAE